jgi:hypothetical protein
MASKSFQLQKIPVMCCWYTVALSELIFNICRLQKLRKERKTKLARQKKKKQVEEEKNDNYDNEKDDYNIIIK